MNYFELYPGDYLRDTTRLTLVQHGAYLRLLMAYYSEEEPLPAEVAELYTIAGATTPSDREAVRKVADKFFPIGPDGLRRNGRADEEIAKAATRMADAPAKKTAEAERQKRARERRAAMYEQLREFGVTPSFKATTAELQALLDRYVTRDNRDNVTQECHDITRDNTATRPQTPDPTRKALGTESSASTHTSQSEPTPAGRACLLMRRAGCIQTNPSHPALLAALEAGATPEELADTAREAVEAGKNRPFAWACITTRSRREQLTHGAPHVPTDVRGHSRKLSVVERAEHHAAERARQRQSADERTVIDGEAVRVDAG